MFAEIMWKSADLWLFNKINAATWIKIEKRYDKAKDTEKKYVFLIRLFQMQQQSVTKKIIVKWIYLYQIRPANKQTIQFAKFF